MASFSEIFHDKAYLSRVLDAFINISLTALLVISCLLILKPFVPLLAWGIIIAIASYPRFEKLKNSLGGRGGWTAVVWTVLLLLILIIPIFLFARGVVESGQVLIARIHDGTLSVPPPPAGIETWPLIGAPLSRVWTAASADLTQLLIKFAPEIKAAIPEILSAAAGVGFTVMQFFLAILVSGALLAVFCILDREILGCGIQSTLRNHRDRAIYAGDRPIGKCRGDAHNAPRFLFQHLFHSALSDIEESEQVNRDKGLEVLDSEVSKRLVEEDAGVIHQNIDGSKVFDCCFDGLGGGFLLADIAIEENQAA
jgi:hypothetical protein